jgi:hypothetical protein
MAEPTSPQPKRGSAATWRWRPTLAKVASLAFILEIALGLRIVAADAVDLYVHRGGSDRLCLFPDTLIYWALARTIRVSAPYEIVEWGDISHFALRTPGYPLFLALCQSCFGERTLPVRLVQAGLGTLSVFLVYLLARLVLAQHEPESPSEGSRSHRWTIPLVAAVVAAVNPYYFFMSSLILSEAVFVPLMLAFLCGLASLWDESGRSAASAGWKPFLVAVMSGCAAGAAILVRPSWSLFVPAVLATWVAANLHGRRAFAAAARLAFVCVLGVVVLMAPWWIRNARIFGRFVPTALWMGASLYDGLNPKATGASDMTFLGDPEIWPLDEQDLDAELARRAVDFARENPGRTIALAVSKLGRFWSPWPNAEGFRSPVLAIMSTVIELPILVLLALGAWDRRRDVRAFALLGGPLLYFCMLHLVFASSMRYRIPAEMSALGLVGVGLMRARVSWSVIGRRSSVALN